MAGLQIEPNIKYFAADDMSLNETQQEYIQKTFRTTVTDLFQYGALTQGPDYQLALNPSPYQAVATTKQPLIPIFIQIIPPDVFPSGEFVLTRVPAPQDIDVRLFRTRRNTGNTRNVESTRVAERIVPSQNGYVILSRPSVQLEWTFRTGGNVLASGNLPVTFTSSDPDVIEVSDTGLVTFKDFLDSNRLYTVTLQATRQDLTPLTATVTFTSDPSFEVIPASEPEPFTGVDNQVETLVSTRENLGEDFVESAKERYLTFRNAGGDLDDLIADRVEDLVIGREAISDIYAEQFDLLRERRTPGANERYLRNQINIIKELPPLLMYVNPSSFKVSYNHIISDGNRGRDGYIIEHFGMELPKLSASGNIGGAYIHAVNGQGQATGGLTRALRRGSAAFQKFMSLYHLYRNNSYIYNLDDRISMIGSVKLFYDNTVYTGSFESFSISESEDTPFDLTYSFDFTIHFEDQIIPDPIADEELI